MKRRAFTWLLLGAAFALSERVAAQGSATPTVGLLISAGGSAVTAFRQGLAETGYVEGHTVALEHANIDQHDLPTFAKRMIDKKVDVLAALGGPSAYAAKAATRTIPVVFSIGGDPVEVGLVPNMNRPGGNITGVTFFAAQLLQKQVALLRELLPGIRSVSVLVNPGNSRKDADLQLVRSAAQALGLAVHVLSARTEADLEPAFLSLRTRPNTALLVTGDAALFRLAGQLAILAQRHKVAALFWAREFAELGGLMSYGAVREDAYRQTGIYVGRILKGEPPGDLPVLQPTRFELAINLRTAKAIGVDPPLNLLALADTVIE